MLEPRSRRPNTNPFKIPDSVKNEFDQSPTLIEFPDDVTPGTPAAPHLLPRSVTDIVGDQWRYQHVLAVIDGGTITITNLDGEIHIEHTRPATGVTDVGNGRPSVPRPKTTTLRSHETPISTKVIQQNRHRCPAT